ITATRRLPAMDSSAEPVPRAPADPPRSPSLPPIFIHSSFRVSSTWIWWRFRQNQDVVAYCEVFHEGHATLDAAHLCAGSYKSWNSAHPESAPYNLEYLPLLDETGRLATYDASMAFDLFMPTAPDRSITEAEARHIGALIDKAHDLGRTPVITDVRTLGRVHGLRRRFGGFHVLWYRDLFRQWCSYSSQALSGNPYFNDTVGMVLERNRHDRFLAALGEMFPLDGGEARPDDPRHFQRFVLLHLYLYMSALPDCDLAISADRLATTPAYRQEITGRVRAETGIAVDLGGCRTNIEVSVLPLTGRSELMEAIRVVAGTIPSFLPGWSEAQALFLQDLLDGLETEIERYAFYTGKLHAYVSHGFRDLPACRAALESLPALREERDRLTAEQASLLTRCEQVESERAAMAASQAHHAAERDAMMAERDKLAAERDAVMAERDRLAAERDAVMAERDRLAAERDAVMAERDRLAAEGVAIADEQAGLTARAEEETRALRQELDQARRNLAALHASTSWRISRPVRVLGRLLGRAG
ncbi:MAG TPA: hypothetical protein VMI52_00455, partial [Acetobacteraceae bacterium]|nr:hypothetical protein [Acetobacteraceae bacterium]